MRLQLFLVVAFTASWTVGAAMLPLRAADTVSAQLALTGLAVVYMFGPLLGVLATRTPLRSLGLRVKPNAWWLVAWLGPIAYAALTLATATLLPGIELSADLSGFWTRLEGMVPDERLDASRRVLESASPAAFWGILVVQPLVAGATVNAIAAFGEEIGWRGFLYTAWARLGFWRQSLLVGAVWGIWHAPLIAQGHNYPTHPFVGIGMMIAWCMLLAPPLTWLRARTGSVVAVAICHGTLNASAGIALMFVAGGNDLLVGVTGLAGLLALVPFNLLLAFSRHQTGKAGSGTRTQLP